MNDVLPGAGALARALTVLARSKQGGVLRVEGRRGHARIEVRQGGVVSVSAQPDDGNRLGQMLRSMGAWDGRRASAVKTPRQRPIGRWALEAGVTNAGALSFALRRQLRERMRLAFGLRASELNVTSISADGSQYSLVEPVPVGGLVLDALRSGVEENPCEELESRLGDAPLRLTSLGTRLLDEGPLWPEEAAIKPLLEVGASASEMRRRSGGAERAIRMVYALWRIGAVGSSESDRGCSLLIRKRTQVRRHASAIELLDLPRGAAPAQARRAYRRLCAQAHPDRFAQGESPVISRAATQVMHALADARHELESAPAA